MSGHSKWSTIKRKKGAADAKRGKIFSKLIREISIAARMGGGDPAANPRLRLAIQRAKAENMPNDNIERAIKKGLGQLDGGANYEETTYEGYGPAGVAILVEAQTDNKNRTTSEVRHLFTKYGGNLGENGCVAWMFEKKGLIVFDASSTDEDKVMEIALEGGAKDIETKDNEIEVTCAPADFEKLKTAFEKAGMTPIVAEISMIPQTTVKLDGKEAEQTLKLLEALEDHDDVQNVYANFDIPKETMEKLEGST